MTEINDGGPAFPAFEPVDEDSTAREAVMSEWQWGAVGLVIFWVLVVIWFRGAGGDGDGN